MSATRLPILLRRSRRRIGLRLARASRQVRRIGAPRVHDITPEVRALIQGYRGVF
ncbi:hypothetical protein L0V05_00895 [Tabrizicola sp. J26]|uniref:hypothetical protein n=1 Tax=Alitabrizicola rongguiensis TaxID=2909234 RepID=UPI001F361FFA|nr:hypothetical protein [Tabrizicola rongguiensis]MCF1707362.1 hypothetical protein [Tabrizicola rongguiensis]